MPTTVPLVPGRPREARVDEAVRDAVVDLLTTEGYAGTTIGRIAQRAGVGRGALYRRWRSKPELVFAATVHGVALPAPEDTGTLEGDLVALAHHIQALIGSDAARAAMPAVALELRADPALAGALEERLFAAERAYVATILARAGARGEALADEAGPELVRLLLVGPLLHALLFSPGTTVDAAAVARVVARGLAR
jgi:AcrR family transcriptional regulator